MSRLVLPASGAPACRVSVIGPSGSGKTTLAQALAERSGLPLHELDSVRRDQAGQDLPAAVFADRVAALVAQDRWIIDGHYRDVRELIWDRADMVIWLNYPMTLVAWRLLERFIQKRRPIAAAHPASMPIAFDTPPSHAPIPASWGRRLGRLARTLRERGEYHRILRAPGRKDSLVELRSNRAARQWFEEIGFDQKGTGSQ